MSEIKPNTYDKMPNFIESMFNVFQLVNKKAEQASDSEISSNPRSTSVRLRVAQRVEVAA